MTKLSQEQLENFFEFLSIPSISTLSGYKLEVAKAADWLSKRMKQAGLENIQRFETPLHPIICADFIHAPGQPTVLIYGHYDVQPAEDVHLWTTPPFSPSLRDGRIYARGASDMKGNLFSCLLALESLIATKQLNVNIKCLFEGEEEISSPSLTAFVQEHKELLACDVSLNCDGSMAGETNPVISLSARGSIMLEVSVQAANQDLHSGAWGGQAPNPLHVLSKLVASFHDDNGRVAVKGFYDEVYELSDAEKAEVRAVPFAEKEELEHLGLASFYGEVGYSPRERIATRPTLEVNGLWGGYTGEGAMTVIPSKAHAKISCRLVRHQNPQSITELLRDHVARHLPSHVTYEVREIEAPAYPYVMSAEHPMNQLLANVLKESYGTEPSFEREGGTIPVLALLQQELGVDSVSLGFGLYDEQTHAPNEFTRVSGLERALDVYKAFLQTLGQTAWKGKQG
jgi:acetylornithine deacetylase/succinyl-diaminopimelate desuccinylase-like protein